MSFNARGPLDAIDRSQIRELLRGSSLYGVPELLAHAAPYLPTGLVDEQRWEHLCSSSPVLPAAAAIASLECRLEEDAQRLAVDVCIRAVDGGRAALAAGLGELADSLPLRDPTWQRTLAFLREWTQPGSLQEGVPAIWLDLVAEESCQDGAPAFVVASLAQVRGPRGLPRRDVMRAVERVLVLLSGDGVHRDVRQTLLDCVQRLPKSGRLLHLAMRPADGGQLLRIGLRMAREEVAAYLDVIGWPGSTAELGLGSPRRGAAQREILLSIDIGRRVAPRLGIQHRFDAAPRRDQRWREVLAVLAREGICGAERAAQLETWPARASQSPSSNLLCVDRSLRIETIHEAGSPLRAIAHLRFAACLGADLE